MSDDRPQQMLGEEAERQDAEHASLSLEPEFTDSAFLTKINAQLANNRAKTENWIAMVLVWSVVLSLPTIAILTHLYLEAAKDLQALFDRWITLVGPLAGAAVGIGAGDRGGKRNGVR